MLTKAQVNATMKKAIKWANEFRNHEAAYGYGDLIVRDTVIETRHGVAYTNHGSYNFVEQTLYLRTQYGCVQVAGGNQETMEIYQTAFRQAYGI